MTREARSPEAANRYHSYMRGWVDGAAGLEMRTNHARHPTLGIYYEGGYEHGCLSHHKASKSASRVSRYKPSPLRSEQPAADNACLRCTACGRTDCDKL